jgi:hypothetical protein
MAAFTVFNTILALAQLLPLFSEGGATAAITNLSTSINSPESVLGFFQTNSYGFAAGGWVFIGAVIWRGKLKSTWRGLGFEQDVFRLFTSARGSRTRILLLEAMFMPKDRLQLANELSKDWNVVDRHVRLLVQHGLIGEERAYGKVRFYRTTESGKSLLGLLERSGESHSTPLPIGPDIQSAKLV